MGRFLDHPSLDPPIVAVAMRQQAVIGLDQLLDVGLTVDAVCKRASAGRLHRIHRTVYSLVPKPLLTRNGLYMAAVLACGPGALLSHRSAAALHGLQQEGWTKVDVTVPKRSSRSHAGIAIHRSTTLTAADATVVNGIPCTTVARTLLDLAEVLPRRPLERAFDESERRELFDLRAINDQLTRNPTRRGAKVVRAVLAEHYVGSAPTRNGLEEGMLRVSRGVGLPDPEVNQWLDLDDGDLMLQPDFMWRAQRLIVETDGHETHGTRQQFESDRRRDQRAMVAGWRTIRTTWRQLMRRPGELQATIVALLAQGPPTGAGSPAAGAVPASRPRSTPRGA